MGPRAVRAIGAALAMLGALAAAGCSDRADRAPYRVVTRLVALRHQTGDDPSTAAVPFATVAGERRPVLANGAPSVVLRQAVRAPWTGRLAAQVPIPERLRGLPLRFSATVAPLPSRLQVPEDRVFRSGTAWLDWTVGAGVPVAGLEPRAVASAREKGTVAVLAGSEVASGDLLLRVTARPAAEASYVTGPLVIPRRGRLRFGVGVDESEWPPELPRATFTLTVLADGGEATPFTAALDPARTPDDRRWSDHEVDLARWAGEVVRLRFQTTGGWDGSGAAFTFPVWADPTIVTPVRGADDRARRRNVLLVSLDTLRADRLGCYGYTRPTSPTIDREIAARGAVFERAHSAFPNTAGSHMTLLTSLAPCVHGVTFVTDPPLRADAHTLAELLRAEGWETAAFTEGGLILSTHGFTRGFGTYVEDNRGAARGVAESTFAHALDWIRAHRRAPWFAFVHTYEVHAPYSPPPGYFEVVNGDGASLADGSLRYDAEIRYTDDLLARLLAGLDALGIADDTVIVLVSDHGEQFGEHGLFVHGNSLFEELLHVPLVVRAPGLVPAGLRIEASVGLIDVVPTVLDLLGLPPPRWTQGRSLAPALRGQPLRPRRLFAERTMPREITSISGDTKWVIDDLSTPTGRLYNLRHDPHEEKPVVPTNLHGPRQVVRDFRDYCASVPAPPRPAAAAPEPDPQTIEKLRALGYVP